MTKDEIKATESADGNTFDIEITPNEVCLNCPNCSEEIRYKPESYKLTLELKGEKINRETIIDTVKEAQKNKEL